MASATAIAIVNRRSSDNPAAGHRVGQRSSFDQLHRQEELAVGLLHGMNGDDAGVVEGGDGLCLAFESLAPFRIGRGHGG